MILSEPKSILCFDLDGTLTPRNKFIIHPEGLNKLLNEISMLGHFVIPVTGKPASYAAQIYTTNNLVDRGIIAENAGVYRVPNCEEIMIYGPSINEMRALREKLGIGMEKVNVTYILINDKEYEVAIDPGDVSILTVFTDPAHVSHRWDFKHTIQADKLVSSLREIIAVNRWDKFLEVLPSFPDGGVQVIRKDPRTGKSIDKASLVYALEAMYPNVNNLSIAMFGDGHNDIPAMSPDHIIPLTFSNAHEDAIQFVKLKKGFVSLLDSPEGLGVIDGIRWLASNNFFGVDSQHVGKLVTNTFPDLQ
jgi:HAD superfamily hydrolase (TIGR01484 family)